jgi:tyrosyl-tRNA synthetase
VAVEDPPNEMFGKLMSVSDELMWKYWLLLTDRGTDEIETMRSQVESGQRHPMDVKKQLARTIVAEFHSAEASQGAQAEFEKVFSSRNLPSEIPEVTVAADGPALLLSKVLASAGLAASNSEARRLISQGAVKVDGEQVRDPKAELDTRGGEPILIQVGKRRIANVVFEG